MILDGKLAAKEIKTLCAERIRIGMNEGIDSLIRSPHLVIIQVEGVPESDIYVRLKKKDCEDIGARTTHLTFHKDDPYVVQKIMEAIQRANQNGDVDGIMVQLPLPGFNQYLTHRVLSEISVPKDVDAIRPDAMTKCFDPLSSAPFYPCTPDGIMLLLDYYGISVARKNVAIIGRSNLVGRPLGQMLMNKNASVMMMHSHTPKNRLRAGLIDADIIVSATGHPGLVKVKDLTPYIANMVCIDVGTTLVNGKLKGDFDYTGVDNLDEIQYTPVPGGVGPMTRAALMLHLVTAWERRMRLRGVLKCPTKEKLPKKSETVSEKLKLNWNAFGRNLMF